jgi:hypothetical protein
MDPIAEDETMSHIHVIHENDDWSRPLFEAIEAGGHTAVNWHMAQGLLDLGEAPPAGVFYNRMSASSHTRGHRFAPEYTAATLAWLEHHGARVVNGSGALELELSKVKQYHSLLAHGVRTPRTLAAVGRDAIVQAARAFDGPFITKHNRAGKGLGVRLFHDAVALQEYVDGSGFEPPVDGITLVQEYIEAPEPFITRVEFVGGRFLYAVRVDTSEGFELCPADACSIEDRACPVGEVGRDGFEIIEGFSHPLLPRYEALLARHGIQVAAFEFIVDTSGRDYTYDINTNTNYNPTAEARAGVDAMGELAGYLVGLLTPEASARAA